MSIIEDIELEDYRLSILDYETSIAPASEIANLQEQFKQVNHQRNGMVNDLKTEGIEIEWDGSLIFVKRDGNPYLQCKGNKWEPWTYQLPLMGY